MFKKIGKILILASVSTGAFATWEEVEKEYEGRNPASSQAKNVIIKMVDDGYIFTSIPWMKEYMASSTKRLDSRLEKSLEKIISVAGIKQFEVLPLRYLKRSSSDSVQYIVAKKYLKRNKFNDAIAMGKRVSANHPMFPFAANLLGTAYGFKGNNTLALNAFKDCVNATESRMSYATTKTHRRQLVLNRDYCTMGIARINFAGKNHEKAELKYLDIPKESFVWPEVLFEEAWNSYYLKNYNRTLGKLVTYNAPIFDYVFNPEIEVLNALTYMKMCLYDDAKRISDTFYNEYLRPTRKLRIFLKSKGRDYRYFYRLMTSFEKTGKANSFLTKKLLKNISREGAFLELKESLNLAAIELKRIKNRKSGRLRTIASRNLTEVLFTQRRIIGGYVRTRLVSKYAELYRAFEGMSYIKLEVLAQKKAKLYSFEEKGTKRGDVKYIERNDKQYFWDFNGEFWADELGDYVFALKSEC